MRVLLLSSFMLLAACGQSGDLYLPAERPEPAEPAASAPAAPAEPSPADGKKDKK